ncbi:MAG TPA: cytochrome c3 family protein [Thermoanaerobaculia bacterium]|nr:cytochrome c3 family protein [Thermoanaerobaculia bacterium]
MCRFEIRWSLGLIALALLLAPAAGGANAQETGQPIVAASCFECHDELAASHTRGAHAGVNCASCHSGAAAHLEDFEIPPGQPDPNRCLACHRSGGKHMSWAFGDHSMAAVECRDCHGVHAPKVVPESKGAVLIRDPRSALCVSCHQEILPRMSMISHHPVKEGALSCVSCHDPHGAETTRLASVRERCTGCHQAVRGPHVFEHAPVVEDCTICHNPHGSPNRRLLDIAQPMLCLQCHSIADNRHGQTGTAGARITGAVLRACTNCHAAMHGSSQDEHLRY